MKDLLLLHGALGSLHQFDELQKELSNSYKTHAINFSGHGRAPSLAHAFTIQNFAHEVLQWMNTHYLEKVDIFGYSMGGYVALWLARFYSDRIGKIYTLGTKLNWNEVEVEKEIKMLQPEKVELKVPAFAQALAQLHGEHEWKSLMSKTALLMKDLGHHHLEDQDFVKIKQPIILARGERDNMVTREETEYTQRLLPNAVYKELEGVEHPLDKVPTSLVVEEIKSFF